MSANEIVAH